MNIEDLRIWVSENKHNLVKYKDYLVCRVEDIKTQNINTLNREIDLIQKGKAQILIELIDEIAR